MANEYNVTYHSQQVDPEEALETELGGHDDHDDEQILAHIAEHVQGNYLLLEVYFQSKTKERLDEIPKYDFFTFLASLGGSIALYLGMSFIALFELFEFLLRLSTGYFYRHC